MSSSRTYKSGSEWAFWRWTYTPSNYITRLHLLKTPWFALMVHWLHKPDPEPDMHDHPVTLLSIIVRGSYTEERPCKKWCCEPFKAAHRARYTYERKWYNLIRAKTIHKIVWVDPSTITFCFVGPKVREWGFHTPDGWVPWRQYNAKYRG